MVCGGLDGLKGFDGLWWELFGQTRKVWPKSYHHKPSNPFKPSNAPQTIKRP